MPKGKGTYGTKKGRPPKKYTSRPFNLESQGRMKPQHGTGLWYWRITMSVKLRYRGVTYTKNI